MSLRRPGAQLELLDRIDGRRFDPSTFLKVIRRDTVPLRGAIGSIILNGDVRNGRVCHLDDRGALTMGQVKNVDMRLR